MLPPDSNLAPYRPSVKIAPLWGLVCLMLFSCLGCSYLCKPEEDQNNVISSGETIYLNDAAVVPTSIPVTSAYSATNNDEEPVSISIDPTFTSITQASSAQTPVDQRTAANTTPASNNQTEPLCPEPVSNDFKKSIAFVSFSRRVPLSSNLGALHQVEQQLPLLIGSNLTSRHAVPTPIYLRESFATANNRGELNTAAQAQTLSKQNRVQFFVSGEVDGMAMVAPETFENPGYYTRFVNGAHNLLHIDTPLDKRSRIFSFTLEIREGFTGQIIFSNQYQTFGKWTASPETQMGFGSPGFWKTDYGTQVQQLVAKASDDMANAINCQPHMARVDSLPGQQQVVIHSGTNNGMHAGDTLDLYQLVYQPISGEYQRFDTRLVKRNGRVHLTEIYPSHSIGHVVDETLLSGQYVVKAR